MARVSYRSRADLPEKYHWLFDNLERWNEGTVNNVFQALAHSPQILRGVMILGNAVLERSSLDPRVRELAIIRVGQINQADYERVHHVEIGRKKGVTEADLENLATWQTSQHFGPLERAVLQYTEEVTRQARAEASTFEALKAYFSEAQLIELVAAVSFYNMMCRVLNSLEVDLEPAYRDEVAKYR